MSQIQIVTGVSEVVCADPPLSPFSAVDPSAGTLCTPSSVLRLRIDRGDFLYSSLQFDGYTGCYAGWADWTKAIFENQNYVALLNQCGLLDMIRGFANLRIDKNNDALLCLISRWSSENNTFVCAWGEFGISVEDVCQLLGLEPLAAVGLAMEASPAVTEIMDSLRSWYTAAARYKGLLGRCPNKSSFAQWQKYCFEDQAGENTLRGPVADHEHHLAAFILAFLSRFVAPGRAGDCPRLLLLRLAAELSLGHRIALAQFFLGNLYS